MTDHLGCLPAALSVDFIGGLAASIAGLPNGRDFLRSCVEKAAVTEAAVWWPTLGLGSQGATNRAFARGEGGQACLCRRRLASVLPKTI